MWSLGPWLSRDDKEYDLFDQQSLAILGAIPVGIIGFAFFFGLRAGIATLIIIRPLCDRLFDAGRIDISGNTLSCGALLNIIVISAMVVHLNQIRRRVPFSLRIAWLSFLLVTLMSVFYSPMPAQSLRTFATYLSFCAMFMLPFLLIKSEHDLTFYLKMIILSSLVPVLYGLFQGLSGIDIPERSDGVRVPSFFGHPNILAFYLTSIIGTILFLFSSLRVRLTPRLRLLLTVYIIPLIILLMLTKTRGAWASSFFLMCVYAIIYDRRALALVLGIPAIAFSIPEVADRLANLGSGDVYVNSLAWREFLWERSFVYIWQRPIFGYGLETFNFYSPQFFSLVPEGTYAHSMYIQFLFETGFVGLIACLWLFLPSFSWLVHYWRFDWRGMTMAAGITVAYLVAGYSDNLWAYLTFDWCFWFILGSIFSYVVRFYPLNSTKRKVLATRTLKTSVSGTVPGAGQLPKVTR